MGIFFKSAAKRYGENTVAYRIFSGLYLSLLDLDNKLFSFLDFDENESFWLFIFNTFLDLEIDEIMDLAKTQSGFIEYFTRINELQIFKNDIFPSVCKEAILLAFKNKERLENTNIFLDTFCMSEMGIIGDVVDQILSDRFTLNKVLSKEI